jgi:hypothetical protein
MAQVANDGYSLSDELGPVEIRVRPMGAIGQLLAAFIIIGLLASVPTRILHAPHPLALAAAIALVLALFSRWPLLSRRPYLRIDAAGIEHFRLGRVPWPDIEGIGMTAFPVRNRLPHTLHFNVVDPSAYLGRCGPFGVSLRALLSRRRMILMPLGFTDADPLQAFEAATRFRSAFAPPAVTGWEGTLDATLDASFLFPPRRMSNGALSQSQEDRRIERAAFLAIAIGGGWTSWDTPDVARKRVEAAKLRAVVEADQAARFIAQVDSMVASGNPADLSRLDAVMVQASLDSHATSAGRRLQRMEGDLDAAVARRIRFWQVLITILVAGVMVFAIYTAVRPWLP